MPTQERAATQTELKGADLAIALLGLGLVPRALRQNLKAAAQFLKRRLVPGGQAIHAWHLDRLPAASWSRLEDAHLLVEAVRPALSPGPLRISLAAAGGKTSFKAWNLVHRGLHGYEVALHLACQPAPRPCRFRWPMRIGYLPGEGAADLAAKMTAEDYWGGLVFRVGVVSRRAPNCELLVIHGPVDEAQAAIERTARAHDRLQADIVAVFDDEVAAGAPSHVAMLEAARVAAGAGAAVLFPRSARSMEEQVSALCVGVSHNRPLDVALSSNFENSALLVASDQLLQQTSLEYKALTLAHAIRHPAQAALRVERGRYGNWAAAARAAPAGAGGGGDEIDFQAAAVAAEPTRAALGETIERNYRNFGWHGESHEASDLGRVMSALAEDDERFAGARYLQAGFTAARGSDRPLARLRPLSRYLVKVFVDQVREGFAHGNVAFPDLPPPEDGREHILDVVFWEPTLCPTPRVGKLKLPSIGGSKICVFPLRTRLRTKRVNARITILHRNRVLQTGTLSAPVGRTGKVTFELDAIPRRVLSGLEERTSFSLAMVLNDSDGEGAVHLISNGKARTLDVDDNAIGELVKAVGGAISRITDAPANYQGLFAPGSEELLRALAQKGSILREYLQRYAVIGGKLETPEFVQVVSTKPGKIFPLEFIYDERRPKPTARMCPHAEESLLAGDCVPQCNRHADSAKMADTVCPFGFWGLKCVIERRGNRGLDPEEDDAESEGAAAVANVPDEPLPGPRQVLRPLKSILVGATPKADNSDPNAVSGMLQRIQQLRTMSDRVNVWADWPDAVMRVQPSLLALVVHQEMDALGTPVIEIGAPPLLSSDSLEKEYVRANRTVPPPVVLLIGCETGRATISYENFALRFHWRGAAIVVSTIASVLGRQAAPMTADIIEAIKKVDTPTSFAVVMRDLRRRLLAKGTPMVLGLIADGDADWDIVGQ